MTMRYVFDRTPLRVYWEVTRACDLACRHCRADAVPRRHPRELTTAEAVRLLSELALFSDPPPKLVLTGGDPLKRRDLFALVAAAQALGFDVSVSPSGTPLLTPGVVGRLRSAGVGAMSVSLDGSTPERHDAFRGVPGTFARTVAAARAAAHVGLPVQINTLAARETLDDLRGIHEVARDVSARRWSLFFLVRTGRGRVLTQISPAEAEAVLVWLAELGGLGELSGPIVTTTEAPQYRRVQLQRKQRVHSAGMRDGNGIMFISHTGDLYPSGFLPLVAGNVRDKDPVRLYREASLFRALRDPDQFTGRCGVCEFRWQCGGSRARAYAAGGDPLAEDPLCSYWPRALVPAAE